MKNRKISYIDGWYKDDYPNCKTSGFNVCSYINNVDEGIACEFEDLKIYLKIARILPSSISGR